MRETSLLAYLSLRDLGLRQSEVLGAIRRMNRGGLFPTDRELSEFLGYADPNKVRPRRNDLMRFGLVREHGKRECGVSGKLALTWKVMER